MQKSTLNLLGCASFSAILWASTAAQAELATADSPSNIATKPAYSGYVEFSMSEPTQAGCSCQELQLDPGSDTVGDSAIDQYGCDCAGCRNLAMQMMQNGSR